MLRKRISEIIPWHAGGQRAPNKPLMLLLAIANVQKGHEPLVSYRDIEPKLREALRIFGPVRKAHFPEYPFWHLKTDKVWRVISDSPIKLRKGSSNPSGAELRRKNARGGFLPEYAEELVLSADLQAQVIHEILDRHFPRSIHEDIVEFFELRMPNEPAETGESGHAFRNSVIEAYGGKCAVSGFSACMGVPYSVLRPLIFYGLRRAEPILWQMVLRSPRYTESCFISVCSLSISITEFGFPRLLPGNRGSRVT